MTVETCAHYLTFTAEDVPDGATQYKCAPPLRHSQHRELLWKGLKVCLLGVYIVLQFGYVLTPSKKEGALR